MSRRIVILGHAADRTGPPMYLLQLLGDLDRTDLDITLVLLRGGELLADFEALVPVRVVGEPVDPLRATPLRRSEEPERIVARRSQLADLVDLDLVVVNTAWSVHALPWIPAGSHRLLSVVHELAAGIDLLDPPALADLLASDRFLAGCSAVVRLLVDQHGVDPTSIDLVPYGIGPGDAPDEPEVDPLHTLAGSFVVAAAAVPDRRKAPDLFVHLAAAARRFRPDVTWAFRWIGASEDDDRLEDARTDRALLDADDLVAFLPSTPHLRHHLQGADAFVLPSREDAFPLAALEAAAAGLPVLCFDVGGIADLVGTDAGQVVAFPDVEAMADVLIGWHDHPDRRRALGAAGRERVATHHDAGAHAVSVRAVLDRLLTDQGA